MSVEFVDTNVLIYAHDGGAGSRHDSSVSLLKRLFDSGTGALSVQVLSEFYAAATKKLGMKAQEAEDILNDLEPWKLHRPSRASLLAASRLHRQHKISWWDALILQSALELGSSILWSEDFTHGQRFGTITVQNPFKKQ